MYNLLPYILANESTNEFTKGFTKGFIKGLGNTTATLTVLGLLSSGLYIYNNRIHIIQSMGSMLFYEKGNLKGKHQDQDQDQDQEDNEDCASYENSNLVNVENDVVENDVVEDAKYKKLLERFF